MDGCVWDYVLKRFLVYVSAELDIVDVDGENRDDDMDDSGIDLTDFNVDADDDNDAVVCSGTIWVFILASKSFLCAIIRLFWILVEFAGVILWRCCDISASFYNILANTI